MTHPEQAAASTHILLVDDEVSAIHALAAVLTDLGDVSFATSGAQALAQMRKRVPDLVLLDANMPGGLSGLDVCAAIKAEPAWADVPVIFVTAQQDAEWEVSGFDAGAADYIAKPIRPPVVRARVRTQLRLKQLADALRRQANYDTLTGLPLRRVFDDALQRELELSARRGFPVTVVVVDVDHFKKYNDAAGHIAGDAALRTVAQVLRSTCRAADLVARWGGEEFVLLLPQTDAAEVWGLSARLLKAMATLALPHPGLAANSLVSVSLGTCSWKPDAEQSGRPARNAAERLVSLADRALYAAKRHGRNCAWSISFGMEDARCVPQPLVAASSIKVD